MDEPELFFPNPVPGGPEPNRSVNQVFYGYIAPEPQLAQGETLKGDEDFEARDGALSVLSYDEDLVVDRSAGSSTPNPSTVFNADNSVMVTLDTEFGAQAKAEFTLVSAQDTVYAINLTTGEVRGLGHFSNTVCDIIPSRTVTKTGPAGGFQTLTVTDAPVVYIETTEGLCTGDDSAQSNTRRFYRLPVNYKFDAEDIEVCVGEGNGRNPDPATCFSRDFRAVTESEAKARLIFAWTEDDEISAAGSHKPTWGYLGYGVNERKLRFYDANRSLVWEQERVVEQWVPTSLGQSNSPKYLFDVYPLSNVMDGSTYTGFDYLVQIGRDIFALDSTQDLFEVSPQDNESVLSDRIYQLDETRSEIRNQAFVQSVEFVFDDDELLLIDQFKVFRYNYGTSRFMPSVDASRAFVLRNDLAVSVDRNISAREQLPLGLAGRKYETARLDQSQPFSQFDIVKCSDQDSAAEINACENAHDVLDRQLPAPGPAWQFITACEASLGCSIPVDSTDYCVTDAELAIDPSLASLNNPCSVSDYRDLNELDNTANNAEFRGFMQYANDFARSLDYRLYDNSLLVTARMYERDLLLQYSYDQPLSALKEDRETVILGRQFSHYAIQAHIVSDNLFVDLLRPASIRSNECYKNYQRVPCNLGELVEEGQIGSCTGKDLADGTCFNSFQEFKSYALFCSAAELASGACQDQPCSVPGGCAPEVSPVYDLLVDPVNAPQAKWMPVAQQSTRGSETLMMLLAADDQADDPNDSSDSYIRDEGILGRPSLHAVDKTDGSLDLNGGQAVTIATVNAEVESVLSASTSDNGSLLELVSEEVVQLGGSPIDRNISLLTQHAVQDLDGNDQTAASLSDLQFRRPLTHVDQ